MPRLLQSHEIEHYQALRAEMLVDTPHAFLSAPGDDRCEDAARLSEDISNPSRGVIVVEDHEDGGGKLAASVGLVRTTRTKASHRAGVWGVYCTPSHRGRGIARACVLHALDIARSWEGVEVVGLSASAETPEALRLYESVGFEAWGREPDAIRIDGRSYDEVYMQITL